MKREQFRGVYIALILERSALLDKLKRSGKQPALLGDVAVLDLLNSILNALGSYNLEWRFEVEQDYLDDTLMNGSN
jgi:hypothetical protein